MAKVTTPKRESKDWATTREVRVTPRIWRETDTVDRPVTVRRVKPVPPRHTVAELRLRASLGF